MRVPAFRHAGGEDLGSIRPILETRGVEVECVDLYAGAPLPDARATAGLIFGVCLGAQLIGQGPRR
jgi:hypothetical protein